MKKIIALYKTFSGNEWVESSIESIYNHVDKILFLHSDVSWLNERGNTVEPITTAWKKKNDYLNKIIQLEYNSIGQTQQYQYAIKYIQEKYKDHVVFFIDTDEVWNEFDMIAAKERLEKENSPAIACRYNVYIKNPRYMVYPNVLGTPTIFLQDLTRFKGVRSNATHPRIVWDDIKFHHFCLVRKDECEILKKIKRSDSSDGFDTVDLGVWWEKKWKKLPDCTNFHYTKRFQNLWKSIKIVDDDHFPLCVTNKKIYKDMRDV